MILKIQADYQKQQQLIPQEDLDILMQTNLLELVNLAERSEEEKQIFLQKFFILSWRIFFETDGKSLSNEDLEHVENLLKEGRFDAVQKCLEVKYPDLKIRMIKNSLLAKKLMIIEEIEKVLKEKEDPAEQEFYQKLHKLAQIDEWKNFIYYSNKNVRSP